MTVGELIQELKKYPAETKVQYYSDFYEVGSDISVTAFHPAEPAQALGGVKFGSHPAVVVLR